MKKFILLLATATLLWAYAMLTNLKKISLRNRKKQVLKVPAIGTN